MKYRVPVKYTYSGNFFIEADSMSEAKSKVIGNCGMSFGSVISSLPDDEVDWEFDMTPDRTIGAVRQIVED